MIGRATYDLRVDTLTNATTVATFVAAQYNTAHVLVGSEQNGPNVTTDEAGIVHVVGDLAFWALGAQSDLLAKVVAAWSANTPTARSIQPGSRIWVHVCDSDEMYPTPCTATTAVK